MSSFGKALGCVLAAAMALSFSAAASGDPLWDTRVDKDGLLVETRSVEGSNYKAFRARITVPAQPDDVLARLRDVDRYTEWFPDTTEAYLISSDGDRWSNYLRTDAPWPVKDRDSVYASVVERDGDRVLIRIVSQGDAIPVSDDAVRIVQAEGLWELTPTADGTQVHWEFHAEPGGTVPSSLANARVVDTPRKALLALRDYFATLDEHSAEN